MSALPETVPTAPALLAWAAGELRAAGVPEPEADAELLLDDALRRLKQDLRRRAVREPLAYVRGEVVFRGLALAVDERVFVPRPETELLVEAALAVPRGAAVLEPCTGSGAVALALKHERTDLRITATDHSPAAIAVARANAERLGLDVSFFVAPGIAGAPGGPWDAIVSNPPYVAEAEAGAGSLPPELEDHEPPDAFWAGKDGLAVYRRLASDLASGASVPAGAGAAPAFLALEVGDGQADAVCALLARVGLCCTRRLAAPSGATRVVVAERS
jgi:release factor glutamine methyltransferase